MAVFFCPEMVWKAVDVVKVCGMCEGMARDNEDTMVGEDKEKDRRGSSERLSEEITSEEDEEEKEGIEMMAMGQKNAEREMKKVKSEWEERRKKMMEREKRKWAPKIVKKERKMSMLSGDKLEMMMMGCCAVM